MTSLRYLLIVVVALLVFGAMAQQATETAKSEGHTPPTPIQVTTTETAPTANKPNEVPAPTPTPTPASTPTPATEQKIEVSATTTQAYLEKIKKIREEVAKSTTLDHKYLEQKIQEVIGSMTPEQKDNFEQQLSTEARAAYQKYKKSLEDQAQKSQQETEQLIQQTKVSESAAKLNQQKQAMKMSDYNTYKFQMQSQASQDLQFTLPIDQDVHFFLRMFTNTDGVYGNIEDIEGEQPIRAFVYQNRDRIVGQTSAYSVGYFSFQGKANSTYLIRLSNQGSSRLVSLSISHILLDAHIATKLTVEDMADHKTRVSKIKDELLFRMGIQNEKFMLQSENEKNLLKGFDHYYFYSVGEIVLLGIICVIQVESIRKLLINSSVV